MDQATESLLRYMSYQVTCLRKRNKELEEENKALVNDLNAKVTKR